MIYLDKQLKDKYSTTKKSWNNHWNNHIRFCIIIEPYLIFYYFIKNRDIDLYRDVQQEICIIF